MATLMICTVSICVVSYGILIGMAMYKEMKNEKRLTNYFGTYKD